MGWEARNAGMAPPQSWHAASMPALPTSMPRMARYSGRDTLRPDDAFALNTFARRETLPPDQPESRLNDILYEQVRTQMLAAMRNGEYRDPYQQHQWQQPLPYRQSHGFNETRSQPQLPLIAYAGKVPRSSVDETTSSTSLPITRITSAPSSFPQPGQFTSRDPFNTFGLPRPRGVDWRKLPLPVFECILDQLRDLHVGSSSTSCTTCYMRDLVALQLTCKTWFSEAQKRLYTKIEILGADSSSKLRKLKVQHGARLILLRRTLRAKSLLASLVTTLHVPDPIIPIYLRNSDPNPEYDNYLCVLASLVMACPNLESLTGFHAFYNHTFDRLTHALSTRKKLRQHVWVIAENDEVAERSQRQLPPGLLDGHQVYQFLQYHDSWANLETLMLCSPGSLGVIEHEVFVGMLHSLPSLKNLCVSSFDADDFNDLTLSALPHIVSLRLEECSGVSDAGLAKWAASPISVLIETLTLIHQNVTGLVTISKILAGLDRLKKFTIIQSDVVPSLPLEMVIFHPLFASKRLQFLHWDVAGETVSSHGEDLDLEQFVARSRNTPNAYLALSVTHHGFPALTHLRAPRDTAPFGILQSVCRPAKNANVLLPADRFSLHMMSPASNSNSLQIARIRAQTLIDRAALSNKAYVKVVVTDHSNREREVGEEDSAASSWSNVSGLSCSSAETDATEPGDLFSPESEAPRGRSGRHSDKEVVRPTTIASNRESVPHHPPPSTTHRESIRQYDRTSLPERPPHPTTPPTPPTQKPPPRVVPPPRSPLRHAPIITPLKVQEFSLPSFIGRISITTSESGVIYQPPKFHLQPDIAGRDGNGGVASWGELLKVGDRAKASQPRDEDDEWIRDGCMGAWNKSKGDAGSARKGERERGRGIGNGNGADWWKHRERERRPDGLSVGVQHFF